MIEHGDFRKKTQPTVTYVSRVAAPTCRRKIATVRYGISYLTPVVDAEAWSSGHKDIATITKSSNAELDAAWMGDRARVVGAVRGGEGRAVAAARATELSKVPVWRVPGPGVRTFTRQAAATDGYKHLQAFFSGLAAASWRWAPAAVLAPPDNRTGYGINSDAQPSCKALLKDTVFAHENIIWVRDKLRCTAGL
ncbi:hypothetical protein J6590_028618 [Homalodisca vitripennis]|nr:hypothetical protein J6590_028618 [Homalodisca vitripennis]